jgi:MoaA/NifB/PqqE/SkfB family radical SAM enzyme
MKIPHDKFCVLPWVSLETSPIGTVRPCCLADDEIVDDAGNKCRLGTQKFEEIRNTRHMQQLREQFLAGARPDTCRRCWAEEDAGRTSKRMHTLDRLKHILSDEWWENESKPLMFLDLKLGNICNLKCRICGSWSSSQFATEELKFQPEKKNNFHYTMLQQGRWPRETPAFWEDLDRNIGGLRYIEFTGGEPFMIQEHFDLLQRIVDRGIAPQVEIHYNTNGTIYPEMAENIWRHFHTVEIALSIDDVGQRFEYQRSNATWSEVCENLDRFRDLKEIHKNIQLQVCTTVNAFNIRYLDHVARWIGVNRESFDFVYWNMLHDSPELSIAHLPESAKLEFAEYLRFVDIPYEFRREFDRIIDFMMRGVNTDGEDLKRKIKELDQRRNQNLAEVMPELARAIGL